MRIVFRKMAGRYSFQITHRHQPLAYAAQDCATLEEARLLAARLVVALADDQFDVVDETGEWRQDSPQLSVHDCQLECQLSPQEQRRFDYLAGLEAWDDANDGERAELAALVAKRRKLARRDPLIQQSLAASAKSSRRVAQLTRELEARLRSPKQALGSPNSSG